MKIIEHVFGALKRNRVRASKERNGASEWISIYGTVWGCPHCHRAYRVKSDSCPNCGMDMTRGKD